MFMYGLFKFMKLVKAFFLETFIVFSSIAMEILLSIINVIINSEINALQ